MSRLSERKIVLIHRETRLDELVKRHNTLQQAKFYVESRGDSFDEYVDEGEVLKKALKQIRRTLDELGRVQVLERGFLPNFLFGPEDLIVVSGQDGLVANTLKYLNGQPLLAVNPAPELFDGQLLPFGLSDIRQAVEVAIYGKAAMQSVSMARAKTNDGQELLAVNDFYIGPRLPTSARYEIQYRDHHELQSSSGVLVSTGFGSTGWMRSVVEGANAVVGRERTEYTPVPWDSRDLIFSVREPFPSNVTGTSLVYGKVVENTMLVLRSRMAEGGVLFSDGVIKDSIDFNSGTVIEIDLSPVSGALVAG